MGPARSRWAGFQIFRKEIQAVTEENPNPAEENQRKML
jgi:hypothetical protein